MAGRGWRFWRRSRPQTPSRFAAAVGVPPGGIHPGWSADWSTPLVSPPGPAAADPVVRPVTPRVVLGFADGTEVDVDVHRREGRSMLALAATIAGYGEQPLSSRH